MHSYNHRRDGADGPEMPFEKAPQINIGTSSMDRERWADVLDPFIEQLRRFRFRGEPMDVRENIAFQGKGEQTRFVHERFPKPDVPSPSSSRNSSWTNGPGNRTLRRWPRCAK